MLASIDRGSENILVMPVIVAELELGNIQVQVLFADLVEGADAAAFDQRPEAFDGLSVDRPNNVLFFVVVDGRVGIFFAEPGISGPLVGAKQADFMRNSFTNESGQCRGADVLDHAANNVAFTPYSADNGGLAGTDSAASTLLPAALVLVSVAHLAADESLINLDNAAKLFDVLDQRSPDFMAHEPSGFVGAEAHIAHNLERAHSLFADQHQMGDFEPISERLVCVLEYGSSEVREPIGGIGGALVALPVPRHGRNLPIDRRTAARATDTFRPAAPDKVGATGIFVREHLVELGAGQLMDRLGHGRSSSVCRRILPCPIP